MKNLTVKATEVITGGLAEIATTMVSKASVWKIHQPKTPKALQK